MGSDSIIVLFANLYAFLVVLRFLLQIAKADYYNPICQAVVKITELPLKPLQRVIPRFGNIDWSPLVLAFLVFFIASCISFFIGGVPVGNYLVSIAGQSAVAVVEVILRIYFYAVIGSVIISWVAPGSYHPGPQLITQLTEPVFKLFRNVVPPIGGLDLSPILIFIIINFLLSQLESIRAFM